MDMGTDPELAGRLLKYLPTRTRQMLQEAIDEAYTTAGHRFDPEVGDDAQLFGFELFKYVSFQIRRRVESDTSYGLELIGSSTGAFRLRAGPFILAPYSCGPRDPDNPRIGFPSNDKGAGLLADLNSGQMELFARFAELSDTALVIGHYGNPTSGLQAVFLKEPVAQTLGRISRWGHIEPVFRLGGGVTITDVAPSAAVLPPPARVTRTTVLPFRKRPQTSESEGA